MTAMKLLAVHHGGGVGGAPVSLLKLLSHLDPAAFSPSAIFTEPGDILTYARELNVAARVEATGGAFFYSAHARLEPRSVARFLRTFPRAVQVARDTLRRDRPDLLHLNTSVLLAWAAAARRERVPVVWLVREVLGPNPWLRRWHAGFITSHARRVVAISDAVRACFPSSAEVQRVYNAVDLAEFAVPTAADRARARHDLGLTLDRNVVMAIGSVQRVKGHWLLLDALAQLSPTTDLVLITGGVPAAYASSGRGRIKHALGLPLDNLDALLRDATARGLANRIHVTGFRRDIAHVLAAADVLAFPSLAAEGFGRPIIEAMACACPVVATDIGPSSELLGADAGRLVPPDATALATALGGLLDAPAERHRLGQAGRVRAENCFSLDRQVEAMSAVYREAVGFA
jgi:glycosyltransferase involved in cell wall biosynthesis